ncbi:hypothetical protein CPB83DRAFT_909928 [Crepidotus variabilis]|uniref:Uncharacterized protein n=1 Tax=Crepidotus variabilis TaxID=179855 RepID=A0A9P6E8L0_9AGAR|nr:hypothetical protein CPB83DRAFT_909928 [Crepidotus variabilis]
MLSLPVEILDLFVDHIDDSSEEGMKTLGACMLSSKTLFFRARGRIFSTIDLDRDTDHEGLKELLEYQAANYPPLLPSIKTLEVRWRREWLEENNTRPEEREGMIDILFLLATPTSRIWNLKFNFSREQLPDLGPKDKTYRAMRAIFSIPTVQSLHLLFGRNIPAEMFDIFMLRKLRLHMVEFNFKALLSTIATAPSAISNCVNPATRFRQLSVLYPIHLPSIWKRSSTSPFGSLQSLVVRLGYIRKCHSDLDFGNLLSISQHSLKNLRVYLCADLLRSYPHTLQPLKSLLTLTYVLRSSPAYPSRERMTDWNVESLLESLATLNDAPNSLQHIAIHLNVHLDKIIPQNIQFKDDQQRKDLLDALSSPRFATVANIKILVQVASMGSMIDVDVPFLVDFPLQTKIDYPRIKVTTRRFRGFIDEEDS